jgi:hypothetical protein
MQARSGSSGRNQKIYDSLIPETEQAESALKSKETRNFHMHACNGYCMFLVY